VRFHRVTIDRPLGCGMSINEWEGNLVKTLLTTLLTAASVLAVGVSSAQDSEAPAATPAAQAMCCMDSSAHMGQMDGHMKRMQALHEQRASATTPEDRQRLMQ